MAYTPPRQSGAGQIVDSVLILAILLGCLLLPFEWKKRQAEQAAAESTTSAAPATEAAGKAPEAAEAPAMPEPTWESLGQNKVQAEQWEKLGKKPADAKDLIEKKFDFEADLRSWKLWVTIVVIVAYFFLLLRLSDREYREVINERFGAGR
jgi:hypothetical protein